MTTLFHPPLDLLQPLRPALRRCWYAALSLWVIGAPLHGACAAEPTSPADASPEVAAPQGPQGSDPEYVIGPGDTIQVFVWREPDLSVTVPVRPDGKISTPLVEDMVAVGRTSSELARAIETVLSEYIRTPQVNIIVTNPVSAYSQIKVIGEVANPQSLAYREGLTVLDVVLAVGGLTEFASGNRAKIVRKNEDGKPVEIRVRLESLLDDGRISENVDVLPGDVIIVPESFF